MGVCINFKLAQEQQHIKATLDNAQLCAEDMQKESMLFGVGVEIRRPSDCCLLVDVSGCETLGFDFKPMTQHIEKATKEGWNYTDETLKEYRAMDTTGEHYEKWPGQKLLWASNFCKTQFAKNLLAHKIVADLVRIVASRCRIADVSDEGDYYHTHNIDDAGNAIAENGAMIDAVAGQLEGMGYEKKNIVSGKTTIK